jgi:sugar fermentation stimulation protein A
MKFEYEILIGKFIKRPNRFIAHMLLNGEEVIAHVPNTGRMKELCIEGVEVGLSYHDTPTRKTKYEFRLIKKNGNWISIDSQLPNKLAIEAINNGFVKGTELYKNLKSEVKYNNSRFDIYLSNSDEEKGCFIEVKGVTLERDQWTYFPDAPTERGTKHINELIDAFEDGYKAMILFIVQLENSNGFTPNYETDPKFSKTLEEATKKGVEVQVLKCTVDTFGVEVFEEIPLVF